MTFVHIADLHACRARLTQCLKVLDTLYNFISHQSEKTPLIIAGDLWHYTIQNTEASGFTEVVAAIKKLIDITDVIIISGTPFHEPEGSLKIFKAMGAYVFESNEVYDFGDFEIVALPEPRKYNYIGKTSEEINKLINKAAEDFILSIPEKTKPRILVAHNEVAGAKYQNGMVASSPVALKKNLLQTLNADYYAFGHIHEPQILWDNAEYSGSCVPVNSGEHHDAGFNVISITDGKTIVTRHSFGFPQNITIESNYTKIDELKTKDFSNKHLTVKLHLEKLLKKSFNQKELEEEIKKNTNAVSVKVQFIYQIESNIRSEEIVNEKSIVEKFKIYADINELKYRDETITKLQDIQDNLLIDSFVPCDTFELVSLELRGAIGIKDGMGLDEYVLDFSKYSNGVLALIGKNGAGKTTLIENCHPFPKMLTRKGTLQQHFCLKDSYRKITYKTSKGSFIKISMFINGTSPNMPNRYLVEKRDDENSIWTPVRSVDGNLDSYNNWVENTFGTVDMFLRTSFYANKHIKDLPDLSEATKIEKMRLFTSLAGSEYLASISESAKEHCSEIEKHIKEVKTNVKDFEELSAKYNTDTQIISDSDEQISVLSNELSNNEKTLAELEEKQKNFLKSIGSSDVLRRELVNKRNRLVEVEKNIESLKINIEELERDLDKKDFYQEQIDWWDNSIKQEEELRLTKDKSNEAILSLSDKKTELKTKEMKLNTDVAEIKNIITKLQGEKKLLERSLVEINDICPVCGEKLSEPRKKALEAENCRISANIESKIGEIDTETDKINSLNEQLEQTKKEESEVKSEISTLNSAITEINTNLSQLSLYRDSVDIDKARFVIEQLEPLLNSDSKTLQQFFKEKEELENDIKSMEKEMEEIPEDYSDKINKTKDAISYEKETIAECKANKENAEHDLETIQSKLDVIKDIDSLIKKEMENLKDYTMIQKAFSETGIQALELDHTAPEISHIANNILSTTYGDRFSIRFDTQRESSDKRKIDDFVINVFDSKTGRDKRLDLLCGGETVWIKQALYYAFSVVRSRKSGFCFKTRFSDESDGTLDSESRVKYLRMIEMAHKECNASLTVLITHSQEIKDIAEQRLELTSF